MASEARKRLPILRRPRSVYMATQTRMFPAIDRNMSTDRKIPGTKEITSFFVRYALEIPQNAIVI